MPEPSESTPKTVFVIGAGASKEAGLPIGSELKSSIAKALDIRFQGGFHIVSGDNYIVEALRLAVGSSDPPSRDINPFLHAGWHIRDAMPQALSIDHFIDSHRGNKQIELCGKLAIVRTILETEAKSALFVDQLKGNRQIKFDRLTDTWFHRFLHLLTENSSASELAARLRSIALVIFNYDRCVEHYLYHAIQNYYSINGTDVAKLFQDFKIFHPYGTVGSLPWDRSSDTDAIEFGDTPHAKQLLGLASQIKTFTEVIDDSSSDVNSIRLYMKTSPKLVFLGFAFHRMNIDLLLPNYTKPSDQPVPQRIFATAYDISDGNAQAISDELAARCGITERNIHVRNRHKCSELFYEYSRRMSFAR